MSATETEQDEKSEGQHVCPECGETFGSPMHLGLHRFRSHGVRNTKGEQGTGESRPRRGRPPGSRTASAHDRRRKQVRETLQEIVGFRDELRGTSTAEPSDLADVIRRDADKIAEMVACWCDILNPLGKVVDRFMHGVVIATVRGLAGIATQMVKRMRESAEQREQEQTMAGILGEDGTSGIPPRYASEFEPGTGETAAGSVG